MEGEEQSKLFCSQCGKELPYNAQFCQHCGQVVAGTAADAQRKDDFKRMEDMANEGRMNLVTFLIILYAIPALIAGIYSLCSVDMLTNQVWRDYNDIIVKDWNMTQVQLHDMIQWISVIVTLSGACAAVSAILCFLRRYWLVAVILCFAAAILCIWSIFGAIIGIFVGWMLMTAKISFDTPREFGKT